nr:iron ABC transporter substrate-binding protein [uncultured Desulfobulbus sp.]
MRLLITISLCLSWLWAGPTYARTIIDTLGRAVEIPEHVERVICSGAGCLRLLTYLQAQDLVVAVDDIEGKRRRFDARPYALANPQFKKLPVFGSFRGQDNPERILTLDPAPQVIFKLVGTGKGTSGLAPDALQMKTGIPVVALPYGNLGPLQNDLNQALRIMGDVLGRAQRAQALIDFFEQTIADLKQRTAAVEPDKQAKVYIGGVAYAGPHGFQATEAGYPPFAFVHARNLVPQLTSRSQTTTATEVGKEQIVAWDPAYLFLDLSTLQLGEAAGGLHELKNDPAYQMLTAVQQGRVYGVLPYNWYNKNFGSILADAYFIGKLLSPGCFTDIDPVKQADHIYEFLVGRPLYSEMSDMFQGLAFKQIPLH